LAKLDSDKVPELIDQLLSAKTNISAIYTRSAIKNNPQKVINTLLLADDLADTADAYAEYDYRMNHELAFACGNPIYVLTLNGFKGFYARIAKHYFADERTRHLAQSFFKDLKALAEQEKFDESIFLIRKYGLQSGELWQEIRATLPADIMDEDA
jgi:GntR family negative regulator for fad regulon and positive regulator of fabA